METVVATLGVAALAIVGQWLLKRQDYKRQDEIEQRLASQIQDVHKIVNQQLSVLVADLKEELGAEITMTTNHVQNLALSLQTVSV